MPPSYLRRLVTAVCGLWRRALLLVAYLTISLLAPTTALAGTANIGLAGAGSNPIGNMTWGYYRGSIDEIWPTYAAATGDARQLLAEVALRPEANWFGPWETPAQIRGTVARYISDVSRGNSSVLAQLSDFGLSPWEEQLCSVPETPALVSSYQRWNNAFAAGIGNARTLVVMQPDMPEAKNSCLSSQTRATYLAEIAWATSRLNALKRTTVYIDAGSSDWASVRVITRLLIDAGISSARGFALDATHYASTQSEITYGAAVSRALARRGYPNKHFIIDTAENGSPFNYHQLKATGSVNPPACQSVGNPSVCQTFGIPPTWQVSSPEWKLGGHFDALARRYVDGYVWFGRPWLYAQATQFDCELVEQMARSTPFPYPEGATTAQHASAPRSRAAALPADPYCPASSLS